MHTYCTVMYNILYDCAHIMLQEEWSGYEFEARLLFKVHSALLGLRELGYS